MISSRERVKKALNHEKPDRNPIDFWAGNTVQESLKRFLGINNEEDLLKRLGVDIRHVESRYIGPEERDGENRQVKQENIHVQAFGIGFRETEYNWQLCFHPLANMREISEIEEYRWPSLGWFDKSNIKSDMENLDSNGEYWIQYAQTGGYQGIFETAWAMRGFERFLMDLVANPELACKIMDKIVEFQIEDILRTLEAGSGRIDMVYISDDLGAQDGMIISPELWRKYIRPREEKIIKAIKSDYSDVKIIYHSCGSISPVVKGLLDIGVDILNPLQFGAKDMDPKKLKKEYGDRLCFHGGMDIQRILPYGTEEEIIGEVHRLIDILGEEGGYILTTSEFIQPDTPPQNIMAMYDAAQKYRYE